MNIGSPISSKSVENGLQNERHIKAEPDFRIQSIIPFLCIFTLSA